MIFRTLCCDCLPIPETLERRKVGVFGRCSKCRRFDILDQIDEPQYDYQALKEQKEGLLGDKLRDGEIDKGDYGFCNSYRSFHLFFCGTIYFTDAESFPMFTGGWWGYL